jgi:hypothetical protein
MVCQVSLNPSLEVIWTMRAVDGIAWNLQGYFMKKNYVLTSTMSLTGTFNPSSSIKNNESDFAYGFCRGKADFIDEVMGF